MDAKGEKREEWLVYGKRWTGMRYHGRDIMVRADKYGLEIWLNRSQDRRRISWRQIVLNQFPQAVS